MRTGYLHQVVWLAFLTVLLGVFFQAAAEMFGSVLGWHRWLTVPLVALLVGIYTVGGGLGAVVLTDVVQCIVLFVGGLILAGVGVAEAGGWGGIIDTLQDREHQGRLADWLDQRVERLTKGYKGLLSGCLANRGAVMLFAACILASLPVLFSLAQDELAPEEDTGGLYITGNAPRYANLQYTDYFLNEVVKIWKDIPEFSHSWQVIRPNSNLGGITLHPWKDRERTSRRSMRSSRKDWAASLRLRPILMTTFATVLGVWPLVMASGPGANSRFSIGLVITAGMLVGTLFTLFVVAVFYLPFGKKGKHRAATAAAALAREQTSPA